MVSGSLVAALPLKLVLYIAEETLVLMMVTALLFVCALFLLIALILFHEGGGRAFHRFNAGVKKLAYSSTAHLAERGLLRNLFLHR